MNSQIILRIIFIFVLSSIFPITAIAYKLFQHEKQLLNLKKDFKLLDINTESKDNVDYFRGAISIFSFFAHSFLPILLTIIGTLLLISSDEAIQGVINYGSTSKIYDNNDMILALRYGFLGSYIYSIQLVYRRYTTLDLQPSVFMNCAVTIIAGFAFNFTAFNLLGNLTSNTPDLNKGVYAVVAFSLGYFPRLAIRWFNQIANSALGYSKDRRKSLPLSVIDGISQFHETRLKDEGIDNVQNLAAVKIDDLLLNTRFNAQQLLEWIDQAILHSYVTQDSIESFRRGGVRKISDFQDLWVPFYLEPANKSQKRGKLGNKGTEEITEIRRNRALQLQSTPEYLDALYATTQTGPNMQHIETYWKNLKASVRERVDIVLADEAQESRSIIIKAQYLIFEEICILGLHHPTREILARVAKQLTDAENIVTREAEFEKNSNILAGLAWWLGWFSENHEGEDYYEQAQGYYDTAVSLSPSSPNLLHELVNFTMETCDNPEKVQEYIPQTLAFFRNGENNDASLFPLSMQLMVACCKTGHEQLLVDLIAETDNYLEANGHRQPFESDYIHHLYQVLSAAAPEKPTADFTAFMEKVATQLS
jgi:hypothetical protein